MPPDLQCWHTFACMCALHTTFSLFVIVEFLHQSVWLQPFCHGCTGQNFLPTALMGHGNKGVILLQLIICIVHVMVVALHGCRHGPAGLRVSAYISVKSRVHMLQLLCNTFIVFMQTQFQLGSYIHACTNEICSLAYLKD